MNAYPQYVAVHKTDTGGQAPGVYWHQQRPESIDQAGIDEIVSLLGTKGTPNRRLAFAYTLSYLNNTQPHMVQCLERLLALSAANDLPVIVHLDGVNWWGGRPDLWNWWDPASPGYNPTNVRNVEWCDWSPAHAVKIGWRNWGRQVRVRPQPNLVSPDFLRAQDENLHVLVPIIVEWYTALPAEKKYLLGGVVLGWEASTYVQAFYYPDGNSYLEKYPTDPSHDPTTGIQHSLPLGYAAATALGRRHAGKLTTEDMDAAVAYYLNHVTQTARRLGLPRNKTITHAIIHTSQEGGHTGSAALVGEAIPGWSFYSLGAAGADHLTGRLDGTPWAAIEFRSNDLSQSWIESFLGHRNCRFVNIYNWEAVRVHAQTVEVLKAVLSNSPAPLVSPPADLKATVADGAVTFSWNEGLDNHGVRLQVATTERLNAAGLLARADVLDQVVTGKQEHTARLPRGTYYWALAGEDAAGNRMGTETHRLTIA